MSYEIDQMLAGEIVAFGRERHPRGSLFIPDGPYFFRLFLCENDTINKACIGRSPPAVVSFVVRPQRGATVATDFPIVETLKRVFGKEQVPDISGIRLAINRHVHRGRLRRI